MCVHALVPPVSGMGRVKFRTLKDLYQYGTTHQRSQKTQRFTFETEEKSESCMCATWCSSCVHFQRLAAKTALGIGELIDKTNEGKRTCGRSSSTVCDQRQHTSSEASNVFSVSSSRDSLSENAESKATFRDSRSCKDVESLLNVRKAQPCSGSGDTPKDLTDFGYQTFSNRIEKHKELDTLDDNVSCISRSDSSNLAIGTHYGEAYSIYREFIPNRSDQSAISSLKDFYDYATSVKGKLSKCSSEQVDLSLARADLTGLGSPIYGVYSCACANSVGIDPHLSRVKTESLLYCKKNMQKCCSVVKNTIMQESTQPRQEDAKMTIDLFDDVIVCDICGDEGDEELLAICSKCAEGAEHTYCMRVALKKVPEGYWMCEECMATSECVISESQTDGVSSTSCLPAKRSGAPLKSQSAKKGRVTRVSARKSFKNGKVKATKSIPSELRMTCNSQGKAKAPHGCGKKGKEHILETESDKKRMDLQTRATFPETSEPSNQSLVSRGPPLKISGKAKIEAACSVSFVKQSSSGFQEKPKLRKLGSQSKIARDECSLSKSGSSNSVDFEFKAGTAKGDCLQQQGVERDQASDDIRKRKTVKTVSKSASFNSVSSEKLNATLSEVVLENASRPMVLKNSSSSEQTSTTRKKCVSEFDYPAMFSPASGSGSAAVKIGKTISRDETFSGHNWGRLGAADQPAEAANAVEVNKFPVFPKLDQIWLGNFQIQRSEGIAGQFAGVQAHLSTHASQKVLELVKKFPVTVVLDELPLSRMWPSQFMESEATEENIDLYFFAEDSHSYGRYYEKLMEYMTKNDLGLKGTIDGLELLIFPSYILPENSQSWNELLFLWGIFRGREVNNLENTPESSSRKRESRDIASRPSFDLNAYPDEVDDGNVQGANLSIEENSDADNIDVCGKRATDVESDAEEVAVHGKLPMEERESSKRAADVESDAEEVAVHGKLPMEEGESSKRAADVESDAEEVVVHGKLPMEEGESSSDNVDLSRLDYYVWQAAENLVLLSKGGKRRF